MADERIFYRHVRTGDRGYLYEENGKKRIRRDSGVGDYPFNAHEWTIDRETRPLTEHVLTQTMFEADKVICRAVGLHNLAVRQWHSLTDEQRIAWSKEGPPKEHKERRAAWLALKVALGEFVG